MSHRLSPYKNFLYTCLGCLLINLNAVGVTVSSVAELVAAAAGSDQEVVMTPGVYQMEDYLTPAVISATVPDARMGSAMVAFSGSNNTFDLTGVTIEVNTELLNDFRTKVMEFYVTGSSNVIKGLTVTDLGDSPTASGGQSFVVDGTNNTIQDVTLHMSGSYPYGYGDLLGKGGGSLVAMRKHSGMLITGLDINILDCSIYSRSFGHLFFIQGGRNVYFENCYAEAVTRTTDEMLAETSGPAFDVDFAAVYANYDGQKVITPGYTKSLSECGFRTYGSGGPGGYTTGAHTFVNCRAKDCRIGFALTRIDGDILVQDCETIGCEAGYNVDGVTIENSRGDAVNGPLLYLNGQVSTVDLSLVPNEAVTTLHAIATIAGNNHVVTLKKWEDATRGQIHPILVGWSRPAGSNPFSPLGTPATSGITLNNYTELPVTVGSTVSSSVITGNGEITNAGSGNTITRMRAVDPVGWWRLDDLNGAVASDSSDAGNHGSVESAEWVVGATDGALAFNGTSSRVVLPVVAFDSISNEVTIAMWVFGADEQPLADTAFYAAGPAGERLLNIHLPYSDGKVYWDAGDTNDYDRISKVAVESEFKGRWNHWAFTKNATAGTMEIYLNGSLWAGAAGKNRELSGIVEVSIGAQLNTRFYSGLIDDVRLYNVALTAQEIELLHLDYPDACALALEGVVGGVVDAGEGSTNRLNFSFTIPASGLGHNFRIQQTDHLAAPGWQAAGDVMEGNGGTLELAVPMDEARMNRFYKLETWRR
ncbi:LamG domain-containing protein [Pontiellaceae bacterium B1224]|nr:LamG domain-containing protein [Pontiellaceae bacterium B1224]